VIAVEELVHQGHPDVVDADLADYFGSIPHADLLRSLTRRIVDRRVLQGTLAPPIHAKTIPVNCTHYDPDQVGDPILRKL
jgi:hypothetical protein